GRTTRCRGHGGRIGGAPGEESRLGGQPAGHPITSPAPAGCGVIEEDDESILGVLAGESRGIELEELDRAAADADAVLDEEVDQLVTVDERDGGSPGGEGGLLRALGKARGRDDRAPDGVEAVE